MLRSHIAITHTHTDYVIRKTTKLGNWPVPVGERACHARGGTGLKVRKKSSRVTFSFRQLIERSINHLRLVISRISLRNDNKKKIKIKIKTRGSS